MFAKAGLLFAAPFILVSFFVGASGVMVVDVREGGPDGHHLVIPIPLALAQAALTFAPDEAKYIECPEFAQYQDLAIRVLSELDDVEDFTLVEVNDGPDHVRVDKVGDNLEISVSEGDGETVSCRVPIPGVIRMVESYADGRFPTKSAIWALKLADRGTLVQVEDGDERVHIRLF